MPFLQHLTELRTCLLHSIIGIFIGAMACYYWVNELFRFITSPITSSELKFEIIGTGPSEAFICKIQIAIVVGILLSCPFTFYQIWKFISPGLHDNEKKMAVPFIGFTSFFFLAGTSFCFFFVLPVAFDFFLEEFISVGISPNIKIGEYLSFIVQLLLAFGVIFELPVLCYFLSRAELIKYKSLIDNFRYAVVGIFIIAGLLTPPDVISQMLMAMPLLVLYGLCLLITKHVEKQKALS